MNLESMSGGWMETSWASFPDNYWFLSVILSQNSKHFYHKHYCNPFAAIDLGCVQCVWSCPPFRPPLRFKITVIWSEATIRSKARVRSITTEILSIDKILLNCSDLIGRRSQLFCQRPFDVTAQWLAPQTNKTLPFATMGWTFDPSLRP